MNIGFLITARLKSTRLTKKILLPLNGYTVIERVIHRAKQVIDSQKIILCTSMVNQDYPLVETAVKNNIFYFNGHNDDVLLRLLNAAEFFGFDYFIGMTADNPLFSFYHALKIKDIINKDSSIDYVFTKQLPLGVNVYGINVKAIRTVCEFKKEIDTEIWGPLINRSEIFNIKELKIEKKYQRKNYRLTLDEINDYKLIKHIYDYFDNVKILDLLEVYKFLDGNPDIISINDKVNQRNLDKDIIQRINNYYRSNLSEILSIKSKIYNSA